MPDNDDHISDAPLAGHEIRHVRKLLRDHDYSRRFWSTMRTWIGWTSASIIFALTFWDKIKSYVPGRFLPWG